MSQRGVVKNVDRVTLGQHNAADVEVIASPYTVTGPGIEGPSEVLSTPTIEILSHVYSKDIPGCEDCGEEQDTIEFVLTGSSIPFANMLRRVMTSEVPTMAFDYIVIEDNDSVVFDEALSHRIGLVPIHAPATKFDYVASMDKYGGENPSTKHFLQFKMDVTATSEGITPVYSRHLEWVPMPGQESLITHNISVVNKDILLTKLGKGQRLRLTAFAMKGIGMVHAKWSPVSCAAYKLAPAVSINPKAKRLNTEQSAEFVARCPKKVFDIEDGDIVVSREQDCTGCRECIRGDAEGAEPVAIVQRRKDVILFTVESLGQMSAREIVSTALKQYAAHLRLIKSDLLKAEIKR